LVAGAEPGVRVEDAEGGWAAAMVAEKGPVVVTGVVAVAAETVEADEGTAAEVVGHPTQRRAGKMVQVSQSQNYVLPIHTDDTKQRHSHANHTIQKKHMFYMYVLT
jgi:hypothetical protein